jgi:phosphoribosyl 1,2-cyclic phosphodiesterase
LQIAVLASGSSGNAILVSAGGTSVLVDAGISARRLATAAGDAGVDADSLEAVLVTHEHTDHVSGLGAVARRFRLPVCATPGTHRALGPRLSGHDLRVFIESGREFRLGALAVRAFATSHDCAESVGFSITDGRHRVAIATDLGVVGRAVRKHLLDADCVVLEFNHDERMLIDGPYPWPLKRRILSNVGHLSNEAAAAELAALSEAPVSQLVLAHLSEENNAPGLAVAAAAEALARAGRGDVDVRVASQRTVLGPMDVGTKSSCRTETRQEGAVTPCTR